MQDTIDEMQAEQRAWIKVDSIAPRPSRLPFDPAGIVFEKSGNGFLAAEMTFENSGKSPAFDIRARIWPLFGHAEHLSAAALLEREEKGCASLDSFPRGPATSDIVEFPIPVLFPGDKSRPVNLFIDFHKADIERFSRIGVGHERFFEFWVYGCVRYLLAGSNAPHESSFAYRLGHTPSKDPTHFYFGFTPYEHVSPDDLTFVPWPILSGPTN